MVERQAPNSTGTFAIGVDLGGTNTRAGVITREGKKLGEARRPSRASEGLAVTQQMIIEAIEEAMAKAGVTTDGLMGIGMGVPGRHRSEEGVVVYSPNFAGWTNINLTGKIAKHFHIATYMRNDVKAASMGEYYFGAGRGFANVVMITLGTGIGGSLISNGQLMLGSGEGFAEVGHMTVDPNGRLCPCGNHGCWEAQAGRDAIIERAWKKLQTGRPSTLGDITGYAFEKITPALIAQAALDGDGMSREVLEETGTWVGIGVANLIQLYDPEIVIIGGGISQAGDVLFGTIRRAANWRGRMVPSLGVKIVPAALGDDAGMYGGATLVFDAVK